MRSVFGVESEESLEILCFFSFQAIDGESGGGGGAFVAGKNPSNNRPRLSTSLYSDFHLHLAALLLLMEL